MQANEAPPSLVSSAFAATLFCVDESYESRAHDFLARAFATDAPILLMDEPFSALDPLIRTRLQDELLELQKMRGRTIIFVSHDLDEAFKIGSRIAIMEGGRIVQCGTPRDIFTNPANEYVSDFVAHMNPLGVLTARDVMTPGAADGPFVDVETPVQDIMHQVNETDLGVTENGRLIGVVTQASLLARLSPGPGNGQP